MKKLLTGVIALSLLTGCSSSSGSEEGQEEVVYACRTMDFYDYSSAVPLSDTIESSYFEDTLFAGDSRMGALYLYGSLPGAQVEYVESLNLWLIDTMPLSNGDGKETLQDVFSSTDKNHIYLLFGINEIRQSEDYFDSWAFEQYQSILDELLQDHPNREIYIILTYHPRSITNLPEPELSEHLNWVNSRLIRLAENNHIYYLNLDDGMSDEDGLIQEAYVSDGLHMGPTGTKALEEYISTHVVKGERYVKEVCE